MEALELVRYLNEYLGIAQISDYKGAYNGLQVAGRSRVEKVVLSVDACQFTIDRAAAIGADMMIVHHGLFWGGAAPVTGIVHRRLAPLIKNDIALYSCHLPLDAHPEVGNNHVLTRKLGLTPAGMFGEFEGAPIGVYAMADLSRNDFVDLVRKTLQIDPLVIPAGPSQVRKVGVLTGGGGSWIDRAATAGIDTYLTGEGAHHTYFEAEERAINVIYAGHYATETVGVKALGEHLNRQFGLEVEFIDHPTGL